MFACSVTYTSLGIVVKRPTGVLLAGRWAFIRKPRNSPPTLASLTAHDTTSNTVMRTIELESLLKKN